MILRPHLPYPRRTCAASLPVTLPSSRLAGLVAGLVTSGVLAAGCGSPGTPQPPSLKLPQPPTDLSASRSGDTVILHWTMPRRATDRVLLTGDQRAVICRSLTEPAGPGSPEPCTPAGQVSFAPAAPATYTDHLPEPLRTGAPRLLTYTVLLENHRGHAAGPSNSSYTAAGAAPPRVLGLEAKAQPEGILLHWQPAPGLAQAGPGPVPGPGPGQASAKTVPAAHLLRLHRSWVAGLGGAPGTASTDARAGVPQPLEQALELPERPAPPQSAPPQSGTRTAPGDAWPLDHATDSSALLNRTYRYTVERVERLTLGGHALEITSEPSDPASVDARDLFPPAVPAGLEAVGDPESGAIDLSWTPDTEADVAGYIVYRRRAGTSEQAARVSGAAQVVDTAWRDAAAQPGVRYAYSVSAVDTSGNESVRSAETTESVTPAPRDSKAPTDPTAKP